MERNIDLESLLEFVPAETVAAWERANGQVNLTRLASDLKKDKARCDKIRSSALNRKGVRICVFAFAPILYVVLGLSVMKEGADALILAGLLLVATVKTFDLCFRSLCSRLAKIEQDITAAAAVGSKFYRDLVVLSGGQSGSTVKVSALGCQGVVDSLVQSAIEKINAEDSIAEARRNLSVSNGTLYIMLGRLNDLDEALSARLRMAHEGFPGLVTQSRSEIFQCAAALKKKMALA